MIPITQTKVVVKNSKGEEVVRGNCFAAAIASILEVPITEVPNVEVLFHMDGSYYYLVMDAFLRSIGWEYSTDDRFRCFHTDVDRYEQSKEYAEELKDKYYFISGKSARGVSHICIYQNGKLVHDPHPTKEGLLTLEDFSSLEKIESNLFQ